jgi:hypothetical protein
MFKFSPWKALPIFNFTIASVALYVQWCILKPWHDELDDSFNRLKEQRNKENKIALSRMQSIESNINSLDSTFAELKKQRNQENKTLIGLLGEIKNGR